MLDIAPLVNKTVPFKFKGAECRFDLSHALFSSFDVDAGTRLLLKAAGRDETLAAARRVLDAGSGTGVIGIAVAKALPQALVEARDRDLLACAFTERNRVKNKVANLAVRPGLLATGTARHGAEAPSALSASAHGAVAHCSEGESDAPRFDFILSNLPAKAGGPVLEAFFKEAPRHLAPGGRLAVVIVKPLVEAALGWIAAAGLRILVTERGAGHTAWVLDVERPAIAEPEIRSDVAASSGVAGTVAASGVAAAGVSEDSVAGDGELDFRAIDLCVYRRTRRRFKLGEASYEAQGYWGLSDFDTIGYAAQVAAELAERALAGLLVRDALVINPGGPGHFPLWLSRRVRPDRIACASRDLLSLAATGENLRALCGAGIAYRAIDPLRLDELTPFSFDVLAEFADPVPAYDWIGPAWEGAQRLLKCGAVYLLVASPTELQRAQKRRPAGFRLIGERRRKGYAAAAYRRD